MVKNLRSFRLNKGLSQQQLAAVIGTTQQSINKYENHATEPDIQTLIRLADCFQVSIDELVGHTPQPSGDPGEALILTREEILLIQNRRKLSRSERDSIRLILENYLKNKA
ncbi:MAG: helix-turn-helix transcriptional regulator [Oscillospiraceae bacterium]|jgi:transcriptional regulator with XRE-family HTH domain|nr:helix-turn-helix transcriptional regulator [Oscillospiraceae bacterium]